MRTIKEMAQLTGVSQRTLRYYEEVDLLKPASHTAAGYRQYGEAEVEILREILLYRSLGLPIKKIQTILHQPEKIRQQVLLNHQEKLAAEKNKVTEQLALLAQHLLDYKGVQRMGTEEKFASLKAQIIAENEANYGVEVEKKYGAAAQKNANQHWQKLDEASLNKLEATEATLIKSLQEYLAAPNEALGKEIFQLHQAWLKISVPKYSLALHSGLGQLYLADPRFTAYYDDKCGVGATAALVKLIEKQAKASED